MAMIRVANAPCSWGVLEFNSEAKSAPYGQVLDEIAATGYTGTELGDWGFMPTDPAALHDETSRRNLRLIAAFVPVALANASAHAPGIATAVKTARLLRDADGPDAFIVLSDDNGSVPARESRAGRITAADGLDAQQWTTFAAGADAVAKAVKDETGLRTVFHPHGAGYVETAGEIDELMKRTDPSRPRSVSRYRSSRLRRRRSPAGARRSRVAHLARALQGLRSGRRATRARARPRLSRGGPVSALLRARPWQRRLCRRPLRTREHELRRLDRRRAGRVPRVWLPSGERGTKSTVPPVDRVVKRLRGSEAQRMAISV